MTYSEKLRDPRWQKKRLKILERDNWECQYCCEKTKTFHVHHLYYEHGREPWEYPDESLKTLCFECHEWEERHFLQVIDEIKKNSKESLCCSLDLDGIATALKNKDAPRFLYLIPLQYIFRFEDLVLEINEVIQRHYKKGNG